jgi:hypothetical protein
LPNETTETVPAPKEKVWARVLLDGDVDLTLASFYIEPGSMQGAI